MSEPIVKVRIEKIDGRPNLVVTAKCPHCEFLGPMDTSDLTDLFWPWSQSDKYVGRINAGVENTIQMVRDHIQERHIRPEEPLHFA